MKVLSLPMIRYKYLHQKVCNCFISTSSDFSTKRGEVVPNIYFSLIKREAVDLLCKCIGVDIFSLLQGDIGHKAAHVMMELIKDNCKIVDRITHKHIDHFVDLLQSNKVCILAGRWRFYILTLIG